ncbi:MAG: hypothetical protein AAGH15_16825 [Myxococcota bacterium]
MSGARGDVARARSASRETVSYASAEADMNSESRPLTRLFANLDRWRHLPAYQLERRADVFFSLYLTGLLREVTGVALSDIILPELPIKRDIAFPESASHQSFKVDYALFSEARDRVFFVELKTDDASRRSEQDAYLAAARKVGFRAIALGIRAIALRTDAHRKYFHLLAALAELGYLALPEDLEAHVFPRPRRGLRKRLEAIEVVGPDAVVEVVYVQPTRAEDDAAGIVIDFHEVAARVSSHDDVVSRLFSEYLRRWSTPAGRRMPPRLPGASEVSE